MKKKLYKSLSYFLATLVLCISVLGQPMQVQAVGTGVNITLKKLIDMSLTKSGVIANSSLLQKLESSYLNILNGTASSYDSYCDANGLDKTDKESLSAYLNSSSYTYSWLLPVAWLMDCMYFVAWITGGDMRADIVESDVVQMMCDTTIANRGETYTIPDEFVDGVYSAFQDYDKNNSKFTYVKTRKFSDVMYPLWFSPVSNRDIILEKMERLVGDSVFCISTNGTKLYNEFKTSTTFMLKTLGYYIYPNDLYFYYSDVSTKKYIYSVNKNNEHNPDIMGWNGNSYNTATLETFLERDYTEEDSFYTDFNTNPIYVANNYSYSANGYTYFYLVSMDGKYIKIWHTHGDAVLYANGWQEYYIDETAPMMDKSQDNTITYTGDYIGQTYNQISYDTFTNNYDNSQNITNNVVGDTITNITNNYYYTDDSDSDDGGSIGGGSDDGGSAGGGIFDGLGNLVGGVGDLVNFVVNVLAELIGIFTNLLNKIMELVGGFQGTSGEFVGFMQEFFSFVPQDIWTLIELGLASLILVCLVSFFKK